MQTTYTSSSLNIEIDAWKQRAANCLANGDSHEAERAMERARRLEARVAAEERQLASQASNELGVNSAIGGGLLGPAGNDSRGLSSAEVAHEINDFYASAQSGFTGEGEHDEENSHRSINSGGASMA